MTRSPIICTVTIARADDDTATMSPKPTVAKTVTVKYAEPSRFNGALKFAGSARAIRKYVVAKTARNKGTDVARDPIALTRG